LKTGNLDINIYESWVVAEDSGELSSPLTTYTFSNLEGDTDEEYQLITRVVGNGHANVGLTFNGDTSNNYGIQSILGQNTVTQAGRSTGIANIEITFANTNNISLSETNIYAVSGVERTTITREANNITGTTVDKIKQFGGVWSNTVDEIISMGITSDVANGLGTGSRFILLKKVTTEGSKTGDLDVQGDISNIWELVESKEIRRYEGQGTNLLLHMDGVDTSTTIIDATGTHTVTANVTAQLDTAQFKFGGSSLLLDGNSDYLSIPDHADWNFGTGDFTIDAWAKNDGDAYVTSFYQQGGTWEDNFVAFWSSSDGALAFKANVGGVEVANYSSPAWTEDNDWHHIALVRSGTNIYMFRDGVSLSLTENTAISTTSLADISDSVEIGRVEYGSGPNYTYGKGWMDEIRVLKGTAVWTDDFTPPTSPYSLTKLLLHMNGADTDTTIYDSTGTHTATANVTAQLDKDQYKWGGTSLLLDGNSDYLSIPDSADWDIFGSADTTWTIDFWVKFTDHAGNESMVYQQEDGANFWGITHNHGSGFKFYCVGGTELVSTGFGGEITDTDWHHVAAIKIADEYAMYVDGVQVNYTQDSSTDTFNSAPLYIGGWAGSGFFDGYIDELRIVNGNPFNASPNNTPDDTITVPNSPYSGATNQVSFEELNGNTDVIYNLITRFVNDHNGSTTYAMRFNNDTANYGFQGLWGINTTVGAGRYTSQVRLPIGANDAINKLSMSENLIYAKSGYNRTVLSTYSRSITGTTVDGVLIYGHTWNDTSSNISNIIVYPDDNLGLGVGSVMQLWRLNL